MADCIFLINDDQTLVEMVSTSYDSEDLLQKLLADYPQILAGEQINSQVPRRWLLIDREVGIPGEDNGNNRWSLDHLFLDQEGIPTLVEVKRSTDTRLRREVVGQMLDYAANGSTFWSIEQIQACYQQRCSDEGLDSDENLQQFINDDEEAESFWQMVKTNLQAGKIRMVFVADLIPPELTRVIEFLNNQMDPAEVIGVEIKQYVSSNLKTLVPRVIGNTSEARAKKSANRNGPREPDKDLQLILDEFDQIYTEPYELSLAGVNYKKVIIPDWSLKIGYVFIHTKKDGYSVELQLKEDRVKPLSELLIKLSKELPIIEDKRVEYDNKLRNNLGRLRVSFGDAIQPNIMAKAMLKLIGETKQKISDEIKKLGLS